MKLFVLAALLSLSPSPLSQSSSARTGEWTARLSDSWTRDDGERWVSFQLERDDDRRWGISIRLADLEGFGAVQRRSGRGLLVRPSRLKQIVDDGDFSAAKEQLPLSA